ncbi:MAG: lipocalin family protein [Bacteroidota bacterium]
MLSTINLSLCRNRSDAAHPDLEKIASREVKTWKTSPDESKNIERLTFWRNGNMRRESGGEVTSGSWAYDGQTLKLQVTGKDFSENFQVLELTDKTLRLRSGDGVEVDLIPDQATIKLN